LPVYDQYAAELSRIYDTKRRAERVRIGKFCIGEEFVICKKGRKGFFRSPGECLYFTCPPLRVNLPIMNS
jgi:hypothetical protein